MRRRAVLWVLLMSGAARTMVEIEEGQCPLGGHEFRIDQTGRRRVFWVDGVRVPGDVYRAIRLSLWWVQQAKQGGEA